jgi:putative transposase
LEGRAPSRPVPTRDGTAPVPPNKSEMNEPPLGRKHPVHQPVHERGNAPIIIFLTVCSKDRKPIFANSEAHEAIRAAWLATKTWLVGRYVIMPDHLHLFCAPVPLVPESLQNWAGFWKSEAARHWPRQADAPIWQRHFWDTQLRRGASYDAKWDYVVNNPVRAELAEDSREWPYQGELNVLRW